MAVLKNRLSSQFSQVPNELIPDLSLSDRGFRILLYLYSRPPNWKIRNNAIMKVFKIESNKTMAKYWNELLLSGWVTREPSRRADGSIKPGFDYELHAEKQNVTKEKPKKRKRIVASKPSEEGLFDTEDDMNISASDMKYLEFANVYNKQISEKMPHILNSSDITSTYTKKCISVLRLIETKDHIPLDELKLLLNWAANSPFWSSLVGRITVLRKKGKNEVSRIGNIKAQFDADNSPKKRSRRKADPLLSQDDITQLYMKDLRELGKSEADANRKKRMQKRRKECQN